MKKYILIAAVFSLGILWGPTSGWAQVPEQEAGFLDTVKSEMASVSEEGVTLVEQNKTLKGQLIGLQLEVEHLERQISGLDANYVKDQKQEREQTPESFNFKGMGSDELVKEAQNIYLSGQTMPLDDVQRLRELQLYELQYHRQELDLEVQLADFLCRKTKEMRKPQIEALERAVQDKGVRIKEVFTLIAEEKRKADILPRQIEVLKTENRGLQQQIRKIKRHVR